MKKPLTEKQFKNIYSKVTRLTVDLIIRNSGGVILTLRSLKSWNHQWHLPGGSVWYKEKVQDAVRRVAREELGIVVKLKTLLGYIEYPSEEKERGYGWAIGLAILCDAASKKFLINNEASQIKIFHRLPRNLISEQKQFMHRHSKEIGIRF